MCEQIKNTDFNNLWMDLKKMITLQYFIILYNFLFRVTKESKIV